MEHLSAYRIQKLDDIGFQWNSSETKYWGTNVIALTETAHSEAKEDGVQGEDREKAVQVTTETGPSCTQVDDRLKRARKKRRKSALEWDVQYKNIVNYKQKWGHCSVPENYENPALGKWVDEQHILLKSGKMPAE